MSWYGNRPKVSAAQRLKQAEKRAAALKKQGKTIRPVQIDGRAIAATFWGKAWCTNLESYSDYSNRLPRGRSYARNGSILDLQIHRGHVEAVVAGSSVYDVSIEIDPLPDPRWEAILQGSAGQIESMVGLLQGDLPPGVMSLVTRRGDGLFPSPREIHMRCSCPDWAVMCKHVAAVLYGVGNRLDTSPELLFTLRGVDPDALVETLLDQGLSGALSVDRRRLERSDLSAIFGVDIDFSEAALREVAVEAQGEAQAGATALPEDLSPRQAALLELIEAHPGLRPPALGEWLGVSRSTAASAVKQLVERGLVRRVGTGRSGGYVPVK
ncbi:MAG: MarR family transcriptional regulator [Deltaproteobacteria bacterium]|nr:MarR family transcriptional regulator [Deltaproteobacteria bacterium]